MLNTLRTSSLLALLLLVFGCASSGDVVPSDKALSGDPEAMWADGQKAVKRGEKLVEKGDGRMADGRKQIREGEDMINSGHVEVKSQRQRYQMVARTGGSSASPKEVAAEAKRLEAIGDEWEDAIERIKDGNALVTKGNKKIDQGQSEIREGRAAIEAGSTLMRNSQRTELGVELLPKTAGSTNLPDEEDGER